MTIYRHSIGSPKYRHRDLRPIAKEGEMLSQLIADLVAPFDGALARVWRLRPGDLCPTCPMRSECADHSRCLHLVASVGLSIRLDGPYRRYPLGARQVGRVMLESKPFVTQEGLATQGLADPGWIALHGIRSFVALPMLREGVGVGVFAVFSRRALDAADVRGLAAVARLLAPTLESGGAGVRGAPLRSLVEIEREAIERTLATTGGRVSGPRGAARILGLKPTTLQSRMKKIGVQRPPR
jgi:hypothetical protein